MVQRITLLGRRLLLTAGRFDRRSVVRRDRGIGGGFWWKAARMQRGAHDLDLTARNVGNRAPGPGFS